MFIIKLLTLFPLLIALLGGVKGAFAQYEELEEQVQAANEIEIKARNLFYVVQYYDWQKLTEKIKERKKRTSSDSLDEMLKAVIEANDDDGLKAKVITKYKYKLWLNNDLLIEETPTSLKKTKIIFEASATAELVHNHYETGVINYVNHIKEMAKLLDLEEAIETPKPRESVLDPIWGLHTHMSFPWVTYDIKRNLSHYNVLLAVELFKIGYTSPIENAFGPGLVYYQEDLEARGIVRYIEGDHFEVRLHSKSPEKTLKSVVSYFPHDEVEGIENMIKDLKTTLDRETLKQIMKSNMSFLSRGLVIYPFVREAIEGDKELLRLVQADEPAFQTLNFFQEFDPIKEAKLRPSVQIREVAKIENVNGPCSSFFSKLRGKLINFVEQVFILD